MDGVALLAIVSALGVGFGWQPMPDGSPRYECIVQIDPRLASTLGEGQSIPLVADVPDDVRPIGRIRVVVGQDDPPRQRLVQRLKPVADLASDAAADEGLILTQFTEHPRSRYGQAPAPPPPGYTPPASQPLGASGPAASGPGVASQSWNQAQTAPMAASQGVAPVPAEQSATWNTLPPMYAAENAQVNDALGRIQSEIRAATEPIQDGIDRVGNSVEAAAVGLGDRTQEILRDLQSPFQGGAPLEPGASAPGSPMTPTSVGGQQWNTGDPAASPPGESSPVAQAPVTWNDIGIGGTANGGLIEMPNLPPGEPSMPPPSVGGAQPGSNTADRWANAADPRFRSGSGASAASGVGIGTAQASRAGAPNPAPPDSSRPLNPELGGQAAAGPATGPYIPAIRSDMLAQPAGRPLEGAAGIPTAAGSTPINGSALGHLGASAMPGWATDPTPTQASAAQPTQTDDVPRRTSQAEPGGGGERKQVAAAIVAWMLLFGSGAGNIYLFWSYLDVRTKYRALVRKTARAVGNRFAVA